MKKLGKKLSIIAGGVVVVLAAVLLVALLFIDSIAKTGVEKGATFAMGVNTTLSHAHVGVFSGEFSMSGLSIDNPAGYKKPKFFELGDAGVAVSLGSLTKDVVEVPTLELSDISVDLERNTNGSNYQTILDNLKRFEGSGGEKKAESTGKKFIIRQVTVRNVTVRADMIGLPGGASAITVPIHEVKLSNVGSAEGGASTGQIAATVVKAVLASAAAEGQGLLPTDIVGDLKGGLSQLSSLGEFGVQSIGKAGEGAKQVADFVGGTLQKAGEGLQKGVEDIGKGLKDLIPGKK